MENKAKILSEVFAEVVMPKKLYIGDPMYFEEYEGAKLNKLVYNKNYRGKSDWVGFVKLTQKEDSFEFEGKEITYQDIEIDICFAPNQKLLEIFKRGNILHSHKEKPLDIGVDTACYVIGINDNEIKINTMGDGCWGQVLEVYNGSKLDGIMINLSTGEYNDLNRLKSDLEYLFNIKFA